MKIQRLAVLALAVCIAGPTAIAATQEKTGCPISTTSQWSPGLSIRWVIQDLPGVMAFQPTKIVVGGALAPLTPAQVQAYAPALEDLRAAAQGRKKVTVAWDDATKIVQAMIVHWEQPCN